MEAMHPTQECVGLLRICPSGNSLDSVLANLCKIISGSNEMLVATISRLTIIARSIIRNRKNPTKHSFEGPQRYPYQYQGDRQNCKHQQGKF